MIIITDDYLRINGLEAMMEVVEFKKTDILSQKVERMRPKSLMKVPVGDGVNDYSIGSVRNLVSKLNKLNGVRAFVVHRQAGSKCALVIRLL